MPLANESALMKHSVTIKIKYLHSNFVVIQVPLSLGLTWYSVAEEARHLFSLSMINYTEREKFLKLHIRTIISPMNEKFDLTNRILYYDIINLASGIFTLVMEGSYHKLNEYEQSLIAEYLDVIWKLIPYNNTVWLGIGKYGKEDDEWDITKEDSGLSILNLYRLRWMSHNTSRLRLYYGNINEKISPFSTIKSLNYYFNEYVLLNPFIKSFIFIYNCTDNAEISKMFMSQLHYVIPESATLYHLNLHCKPLLKNSKLITIEPSPSSSRSRKHTTDPGTRVENILYSDCIYRRIGDTRLTFISMDYNSNDIKYNKINDIYNENFETYLDKSLGNIVLIEYDSFNPTSTYKKLELIWDNLNHNTSSNLLNSMQCPILIYLLIDWKSWVPLNTDMKEYEKSLSYQNGIYSITNEISIVINNIINTYQKKYFHHHTTNSYYIRNWYLQPIDQTRFSLTLKHGFFSGLNWLLRATNMNHEDLIQSYL